MADILFGKKALASTAVDAASLVFATSYTPLSDFSTLRLTFAADTAVVPRVLISGSSASYYLGLNGSVAVTASALYTFTFGCTSRWAYNIRPSATCTIQDCQIDEVIGGVI